ncbi:MAG: response regulator transcription factor [Pyrinomonadaceae bacterium]|nr:response regulator transcription factor [Pyrinomonadaceae bacterium]
MENKSKIRILLVESNAVVRVGIRTVIEAETDFELVAEAHDNEAAVRYFQEFAPDVTLFALRLPDICGVDGVKDLRGFDKTAKIIVFSEFAGDVEVRRALENGASGYLFYAAIPDELPLAIRAVAKGETFVPSTIAEIIAQTHEDDFLTVAELRVLHKIVEGATNKEIASQLKITEHTVKSHVKNILEKLDVPDRTAAAVVALRRGIVRFDS